MRLSSTNHNRRHLDRLKGMSREKLMRWTREELGSIIAKLEAMESRTVEQDALLFFLSDAYEQRWPPSPSRETQ